MPSITTGRFVRLLTSAATNPERASAFTMVEIALCLAIVGFALVAIIGVLPAGLNVQKENREETILNQDSTVWLDAIRAGGGANQFGMSDDLTNYVDRIVVASTNYNALGLVPNGGAVYVGETTNRPGVIHLNSGKLIVGMLSTPRIGPPTVAGADFTSNYVYAYVRAFSGTSTEKPMQANPEVRSGAFAYRMVVDIVPFGSFDPEGILTNKVNRVMQGNLADVRILCRWPLREPYDSSLGVDQPRVGNSRMTFRTQVSGKIVSIQHPFYFLQPRDYQ